jgi:hypothetical protein
MLYPKNDICIFFNKYPGQKIALQQDIIQQIISSIYLSVKNTPIKSIINKA